MKEKLIFTKGKIYLSDSQFLIFPINAFMCFMNEIFEQKNKNNLINLLRDSSKKDASIFYNKYKNLNNKLIIENSLKIINNFGFTEVKLKILKNKKIVFLLYNSKLSNYYKKIYKKEAKVLIEEIIIGFIKNILELIYQSKFEIIINKVNTKLICVEFNFKKAIKYEIKEKGKVNIKDESKYFIEKDRSINTLIKKVIINRHIKIENGSLKIWNIVGVILPYFFLIEVFSKLSSKSNLFFDNLGKLQGMSAVKVQKKVFGIKEKKKLLKQMNQQSEILGGGIIKILDLEPYKFRLINNLHKDYLKFYTYDELYNINIYFIGLIRGAYEEIFKNRYNCKSNNENKENSIYFLEKIDIKNNKISLEEKKIEHILDFNEIFV